VNPGKATAAHLARGAYLYVRQSTLRQVLTNTESANRQYALRQKAVALGWADDQIAVIDTDQGHSGAHAADREGFQHLVAAVSMGKAGIVLGLEVSRLARNNADWHRLLEICAMSSTLICDEDGLYDPDDFNDRLLLGLKGAMSEAELHMIRARLIGGQRSKARRGELKIPLPVGLVHDGADHIRLDPDQSVQEALREVFGVFARDGSARAVVQHFAKESLLFPKRIRTGPSKGDLAWAKLGHTQVLRVLHNPVYAGAFAYGRRRQTRSPRTGRATIANVPRDQWLALIPGAHPGYIAWDQYEANQRVLAGNAAARGPDRKAGPAREGTALLQGIAICGRCGNRMGVRYHARKGRPQPDYVCARSSVEEAAPMCQSVPGAGVDKAVSDLVLATLTPAAIEAAIAVQTELESRAADADRMRHRQVEQAQQRADLARRRYLAVDPANRLVADNLEADWNNALRDVRQTQDDYDAAAKHAADALNEEVKARVRALADNFPALWESPATPARERKRMARLIVEDATLTRSGARILVGVRLRGGQTTSIDLPTPLPAPEARKTDPATIAELDRLLDHHTDQETAELLNTQGTPSSTGQPFTRTMVIQLRNSHQLPSRRERLKTRGLISAAELAEQLGVTPATIGQWARDGLIDSHKADDRNQRMFAPPSPERPYPARHQGKRPTTHQTTAEPTERGAL
jgi:DNA invertase Pin-like site-specific DNA recombinase